MWKLKKSKLRSFFPVHCTELRFSLGLLNQNLQLGMRPMSHALCTTVLNPISLQLGMLQPGTRQVSGQVHDPFRQAEDHSELQRPIWGWKQIPSNTLLGFKPAVIQISVLISCAYFDSFYKYVVCVYRSWQRSSTISSQRSHQAHQVVGFIPKVPV